MRQRQRLAQRLALSLTAKQREDLVQLQARLAKVLSRLWDSYAELLDVRSALLTAGGGDRPPVTIGEFESGATLRVGESFARTDPRLVLMERMKVDAFTDLLSELGDAVLEAPELARLELLALLKELEPSLVQEIADRFGTKDRDTDEYPVPRGQRTG